MNNVNWYVDNYTRIGLEAILKGNENCIVECNKGIDESNNNKDLGLKAKEAWIKSINEEIKYCEDENKILKEAIELK